MSGFAELLVYICLFFLTLIAIGLEIRFYVHMFQLSSYQFQGYGRFLLTHPRYPLFSLISLILLTLTLCSGSLPLYMASVGAIGAAAVFLHFPRPAKKKLVVTARVKRLLLILVLCMLLFPIADLARMAAAREDVFSVLLTDCPLLLPFVQYCLALAALIALPVEKGVQRWYIRDAQKMLREHPGLRIIGITGSFGKTSVKHYLTAMLSEQYSVLMTPGSFNTPMGVVRTIRENLKPTHEVFVCEMGARHVGDIREICDIVHPHDGIITAIGDQHLETFHTRENIIRTKYELLDAVEEAVRADDREGEPVSRNGAAFAAAPGHTELVNGDDAVIRANFRYPEAFTYGLNEENNYRGEILSVSGKGTHFAVMTPDGEREEMTMPLVGKHNVVNVLGAVAMAHILGVPLAKCRLAARTLKPAEHRLELKRMPWGILMDDAYNSNPAGARAALETLSAVGESEGEELLKLLITPGMVELGEKQREYNAAFGAEAAVVCDYILTVGRTNAEAIGQGALDAGFPREKLIACASVGEAMSMAAGLEAGRRRAVLLENDLPDDY